MISEFFISGLFGLFVGTVSLLPSIDFSGVDLSPMESAFAFLNYSFGSSLAVILGLTFTIMLGYTLWTIVMWILRKIPGIS